MVDDPPTRLITNGYSSGKTLAKTKSVRKGEDVSEERLAIAVNPR
jgi:hypothetical protein